MNLSAFLARIAAHDSDWCLVRINAPGGFRVPKGPQAVVHLVASGTARLKAGGNETVLHAGDVAFVMQGAAHVVRDGPDSPVTDLHYFQDRHGLDTPPVIAVGGRGEETTVLVGRLNLAWPPELPPLSVFPAAFCLRLGMDTGETPARHWLGYVEQAMTGAGSGAYLTKLAELLLVRALRERFRANQTAFGNPPNPTAARIDKARELIRARPAERWTVELLAQKVGMSRSSFAAKFAELAGRSPMDFVTECRLQSAAQLLRTGHLPLPDVAQSIGYGSEAAFARSFSRRYGISPGMYRKSRPGGQGDEMRVADWFALFC